MFPTRTTVVGKKRFCGATSKKRRSCCSPLPDRNARLDEWVFSGFGTSAPLPASTPAPFRHFAAKEIGVPDLSDQQEPFMSLDVGASSPEYRKGTR
jgi:hypothetical protein